MKLVDGWKQFWRWHSTQFIAFLSALPIVWMELPQEFKDMIPQQWMPWIMAGLAVLGVYLRLRKQGDD